MAHKLITDQKLRQKYCPPLEESLFIAIASDFDLDNGEHRLQLEQILEGLERQAIVEQELELAAPVHTDNSQLGESRAKSRTTSSQRKTRTTHPGEALVSVTTAISDLQTSSAGTDTGHFEEHDVDPRLVPAGASDLEKEAWLQSLFPAIESVQITETIVRCNGDIQKSVDELLNLSFIHDDANQSYTPPIVVKSVDAFAEEGKTRRKKTRKNRRKQDKEDSYLTDGTMSSGAVTPNNVWRSAAEDVEFIVSRTQMSTASVKSIYHQNNASLSSTIKALVTKEAELRASKIETDSILQLQVAELKLEIEGMADNYMYGALLLAQMIPSAARDLLEAMVSQPQGLEPGRLIAQYTPVNLSEDEKPKKAARAATPLVDHSLLTSQAGVHSIHADRAFSQASSAFRRGKSDRLMGGAAAYYADVGHQQRKRQKELISSAADTLVKQQSTADSLDLHGVSVEHAVRIAKGSVEDWWERLGDRRYVVGGIGNGYKIIVGLGTHSSQGIGRIGPAVSKMLIREGWKVNIQNGEVIVEGKVRR